MQREYIWLDDMPVAMVDDTGPAPVIYYIHTDQLGTPQKITDQAARLVWDGQFDPFGNIIPISITPIPGGTNWGTGVWNSFNWDLPPLVAVPTNLRFPGQYADAETGLSQNWNRDYDPTMGRYVQSDPIGLMGGTNTYGYVGENPTRWKDTQGLQLAMPIFGPPPPVVGQSGAWERFSQWAGHRIENYIKACFEGQVDCKKQLKKCRDMCSNAFSENPGSLPGVGRDYAARIRRCIRECMKANGCYSY